MCLKLVVKHSNILEFYIILDIYTSAPSYQYLNI
jgi:hypothetical protein